MWDMDTQRALSLMTGIDASEKRQFSHMLAKKKEIYKHIYKTPWENLFLIPAQKDLQNIVVELSELKKPEKALEVISSKVGDEFDYLFIDPPPTRSLLIDNIIQAADHIIVPMIPNPLNYKTLEDTIQFVTSFSSAGKISTIVFNKVDLERPVHVDTINRVKNRFPKLVIDHHIPLCHDLEEAADQLQPISMFAPEAKSAKALDILYQVIHSRI
jgi:chromosome partitioning protein